MWFLNGNRPCHYFSMAILVDSIFGNRRQLKLLFVRDMIWFCIILRQKWPIVDTREYFSTIRVVFRINMTHFCCHGGFVADLLQWFLKNPFETIWFHWIQLQELVYDLIRTSMCAIEEKKANPTKSHHPFSVAMAFVYLLAKIERKSELSAFIINSAKAKRTKT